jgi:hypothetical protein
LASTVTVAFVYVPAVAPLLASVMAVATLAEPFTLDEPVTSPVKLKVRAVPQFAVVMFAEPSKLVPLIVRAVCSVVAVPALPVADAAEPVIEMPHVPLASPPVRVGTTRFARAPAAVVEPVPPLASFSAGPAWNKLSSVSKSALSFVPHVSVDAPISGLVKFSTAVKVSAIVGSC